MQRVFLGLGSNVGKRHARLEAAREGLAELPSSRLAAMSSVHETAPVGRTDQPRFLNAAAALDTELAPQALLDALQRLEAEAGRPSEAERERWGPRPLDLDILLWGERVIETARLVVPHPRMHERGFVLEPLAEIAPAARHPRLDCTVEALRRALDAAAVASAEESR